MPVGACFEPCGPLPSQAAALFFADVLRRRGARLPKPRGARRRTKEVFLLFGAFRSCRRQCFCIVGSAGAGLQGQTDTEGQEHCVVYGLFPPLKVGKDGSESVGESKAAESGRLNGFAGDCGGAPPHFSCCELFCSRCAYMFCGFTSFCRIFDTAVCNVGGSPPLRWGGGPYSARKTSRQPCRRGRTPKIPRTRQGVWSVDESLHHCTAVGRAPSGRRQKACRPHPSD